MECITVTGNEVTLNKFWSKEGFFSPESANMAVKFYRMFYKLIITYLAVGVFTFSCSHVIRQKNETEKSARNCVIHFANKVDSCLNPFLAILKRQRVRQKTKTAKLVQTFSQKTFCLHYEETLQCLHETLQTCDTPETTRHVQERLSAPWVIPTNKLCNINMENNTAKSSTSTARLKVGIPSTEKLPDKADTQLIENTNLDKQTDNGKDVRIKTGTSDTMKNNDYSENTSDKSASDSALNFKPRSDTVIQTQTNIKIYLNPTKVDIDQNIYIKEDVTREMSIRFGKKGEQTHTGMGRWKTKIGKLLFRHRKLL